jgi:hypothetical protein
MLRAEFHPSDWSCDAGPGDTAITENTSPDRHGLWRKTRRAGYGDGELESHDLGPARESERVLHSSHLSHGTGGHHGSSPFSP